MGAIHGGTKHNIIGDRVEMQLTVRSDNPDVRTLLLDGIDRVADGVGRSFGLPDELLPEVHRSPVQTTPPTINDTATAERLLAAVGSKMGEEYLVVTKRQGMSGEDFAYFVQPELGVKGVYFTVGGTPKDEMDDAPSHHSPFFKIEPEASIKSGVEATVISAMELMPGK